MNPAGPVLERAHDLLAAALIVCPTETDYDPEAIAARLEVPVPADDDPLREARLCQALAEGLLGRVTALGPPVLAVLRA